MRRRLVAASLATAGLVGLLSLLTEPIRIAGPFNLWPPPYQWFLLSGVVLVAIQVRAIVPFHIRTAAALLLVLGGLAAVFLTGRHQSVAPESEGRQADGRFVRAPMWAYTVSYVAGLAYIVAGSTVLILVARRNTRETGV